MDGPKSKSKKRAGTTKTPDEPPQKRSKTEAKPTVNQSTTDLTDTDFVNAKRNALDKEANFKVTCWNVDGLRAWLKKDGLAFLEKEDADVVCLQETKCGEKSLPDDIKDFGAYNKFWVDSKKAGYAGVAVFSKEKPIKVRYGIDDKEHDDEGRCITVEFKKFFVVCVYVPNAGRKLVTLPKRLKWNEVFKSYMLDLDKKKPVVICGDMNVAHTEIDLANPKSNKKNAGFTQEERDGMTDFLEAGFVDTFRKFYPDQKGAYTFWSYMMKARAKDVGWRLDYFIVSNRLMDSVCDNVIRNKVFGSDHCPITLFLHI